MISRVFFILFIICIHIKFYFDFFNNIYLYNYYTIFSFQLFSFNTYVCCSYKMFFFLIIINLNRS